MATSTTRQSLNRQQYLAFAAMAILPGILAAAKLLAPQQATLMVMLVYFMSRLHSARLNKQAEEEEKLRKEREEKEKVEEEEAFAALPAKKRKNILKAIAKQGTAAEESTASEK